MTVSKGLGTYGDGVGVVTPADHRAAQLGLIAKAGAGSNAIRPGIFFDGVSTFVTGTAGMSYNVAPFTAVSSRGPSSGAVLFANDGVVNVPTDAAPGSNSRIDVVYVWQREFAEDGGDTEGVVGVEVGTPGSSPAVPSLAAYPGAIELARITVPAGVTATNSGTTITQTAPLTAAAGAPIPVRSSSELPATANRNQVALSTANTDRWTYDGSAWQETTLSIRHFQGTRSVANNTPTDLPSDVSGGFGSTLSGGANAVVVNRPGWYRITSTANWATSSTGIRLLDVTLNGSVPSPRIGSRITAEGAPAQTVSGLRFLTAGVVVRAAVTQTSGGALTVVGSVSVEFIRGGTGPA